MYGVFLLKIRILYALHHLIHCLFISKCHFKGIIATTLRKVNYGIFF